MDPHCGDLTSSFSNKNARPGILMCDLFLSCHTEHILLSLAHYCNNRISVNNCLLEAPSIFIICIIFVIVLCRHASLTPFTIHIQLLVQRLLISEPNIIFILLH